jgi:hypothetical protein
VTADGRFTAALRALTAALGELGAPSMIIGGIAVIAAGVPRETVDIDATVLGRAASLDDTVAALARHGILPRTVDALQFARTLPSASPGIVYKAAAWRDRDRSDIERLLVLYAERVDLDRIRTLVRDIGAALGEPDRIALFDKLIERARRR